MRDPEGYQQADPSITILQGPDLENGLANQGNILNKEGDKSDTESEKQKPKKRKTRNFTIKKKNKKTAKEESRFATGGKVKPTPKGLNGKQMKKRTQKQNKPESHPSSKHKNKHFHRSDKQKHIDNKKSNPHVEYPKKQ